MKAKDLKNSILQMAVEGKLVPQDPNDEPASALLGRIREEKHKLIAEGKAKFPKGGESIIYIGSDDSPHEKRVDAKGRVLSDECIAEEVPFEELPKGWAWARLEEVGDWKAGTTPPKTKPEYHADGTIPWLLTGDLNDDVVCDIPNCVTELALKECPFRLNPAGSVLVAMYGATIGRVGVLGIPATTNQACCACILYDNSVREWLVTWLLSHRSHFVKLGMGGAQPNISRRTIVSRIIPLPPLAEQRRIVERVNGLMPLVEEYGGLEDAREKLEAALPARLRKSVLQEAVQGKLVPQDPSDEPAAALLERIRGQRRLLVAEKKMKAPKGGESVIYTGSDGRRYEKRVDAKGRESEPSCIEDEIPFDIPETWAWARLGSIVYNRGQKKPTSDFCYIDISSIDNENQKLGSEDTILKAAKAPSRARKIVARGDVLYATVRPYLHNACVIDRDFKFEPIASTGFAALSCPQGLDSCYLLNYLVSPRFDEYANDNENSKGVAYPAINDARLYRALVPIPPINEQKRIVEKLRVVLTNQ